MGGFIFDEDEDNQELEGPQTLADQYDTSAKQHDSKIEQAGPAPWQNALFGIANVLSPGAGDRGRKQVIDDQSRMQDARKQALADLMMKDKLTRQDVERSREDKKFGWEEEDETRKRNTQAAHANSMRALVRSAVVKDPNMSSDDKKQFLQNVEGMRYDELKEFLKSAGVDGETKATSRYQQTNLEMPDGTVKVGIFDTATGKIVPGDYLRGYAISHDATTGTALSKANPNAPARNIMTQDGQRLSDVRTELEGTRSRESALGTAEGKAESEFAGAEADKGKRESVYEQLTALRAGAKTEPQLFGMVEGGVGPVGGRITQAKNAMGLSAGKNSDLYARENIRIMNEYIQQTTGAAMSEPEARRIMSAMPKISDDDALAESGYQAMLREADRIIEERQRKAQEIKKIRTGAEIPQQAEVPQIKSPEQMSAPELKKEIEKLGVSIDEKSLVQYQKNNNMLNLSTDQVLRELLKDLQEQ